MKYRIVEADSLYVAIDLDDRSIVLGVRTDDPAVDMRVGASTEKVREIAAQLIEVAELLEREATDDEIRALSSAGRDSAAVMGAQ